VGFGMSNNTSPFVPIYHQHSPSSHSQNLKISFHFFSPSFPESSASSRINPINRNMMSNTEYRHMQRRIISDQSYWIRIFSINSEIKYSGIQV
jgi:hypothetical protein